MQKVSNTNRRDLKKVVIDCDLAIVGGGMAGACCAITAARAGIKVCLVQDRPVLGGNASSEVRLWILGATSHLANNNRWAREGGVIDEILLENTYRNPEGNAYLLDTVLLEKVSNEPNITLLLNTSVFELEKQNQHTIKNMIAFCSQNSILYQIKAPLFCDGSGDGILGFLAGASFRIGAESRDEFGEKFAPNKSYGELMGHSIFFSTRDTGQPVKFIPPSYILSMDKIEKIGRFRRLDLQKISSKKENLWWIEYGGRMDTIHDTEEIKWELWRIIYGVWNYFKNSGEYPEAETMTIDWIGTIPGKRESRRFEGDYMMIQKDVIDQVQHYDAVSFGGWSIDLHPADGIFAERPGCDQWHAKGVYQIPYRTMYSRDIKNLFLTGRLISASHVAFGSMRVMATCALNGQAAGLAAVLCRKLDLLPADLSDQEKIILLQHELQKTGHYIPGLRFTDSADLVHSAQIKTSSQLELSELPADGPWLKLDNSWAMLLPVAVGPMPRISLKLQAVKSTSQRFELRTSNKCGNFTPDVTLAEQEININAGKGQTIEVDFGVSIENAKYLFFCLMSNENTSVQCSNKRISGLLSVTNKYHPNVARSNVQKPPEDVGIEEFEFWRPYRRPEGQNIALSIDPALKVFGPENLKNGQTRPTNKSNAWVAAFEDSSPHLLLQWEKPQSISTIELYFDTDFDHPLESVLMEHPERIMPFCVQKYRIFDEAGNKIAACDLNYQTRNVIQLKNPVKTKQLKIELAHPSEEIPAALFDVRCY